MGSSRAEPGRSGRAAHLSLEAKVLLASVAGLCLLGLPDRAVGVGSRRDPVGWLPLVLRRSASASTWRSESRARWSRAGCRSRAVRRFRFVLPVRRRSSFWSSCSCPASATYCRRLEPLDRLRSDPDPAVGADEAGDGGLRRRPARSPCQAAGPVERRRPPPAVADGGGGGADSETAGPRDGHRARLHHLLDAVRGRRPASHPGRLGFRRLRGQRRRWRSRPPTGGTGCCRSSTRSPTPPRPATRWCSRSPHSGSVA